jgi:hypothetical protein
MKIWVDPPEGWRYGFPKTWDNDLHTNLYHWLDDRDYPPSVRESYGEYFMIRQWKVEDEPTGSA